MERPPADPIDPTSAATPARSTGGRWLRRPAVWLLLVALLIAAIIVGLRIRGRSVPMATVTRAAITEHVVASGRVRVATRVQLAAPVAGRVTDLAVVEGQQVTRGETLVRLDDREARAAVAQARAAVAGARGRLDQLEAVSAVVATEASRQAAATLDRAESELERLTTLAGAGAVSRATLEDAERAATIARAQKRAADAEAAAATADGADWQLAEAAVVESEAQLAAATARLADTIVVAPDDGTVLSKAVEAGDSVQPGTPLLELAATGVTELVIEPDERNLAKIQIGQTALASADAFPDVTFEAVVSFIAPVVDPRRGSIEVRLEVPSPPAFLRPDMTVSVDLTVASKADAVVLPTEALRSPATDEPFVWIVADGRVSRRTVTPGIRGSGHTEVTAGAEPGDVVVLDTLQPLAEGERVRPSNEDR